MKGESSLSSKSAHAPMLGLAAPIDLASSQPMLLPPPTLKRMINMEENTELEKVFFSILFIATI